HLQAGSDVDPVTEYVVAVDNDVAEVDANAEGDALVLGHLRALGCHVRLQLDRTAHGVDDAWELQQQSVTCGLDDPPSMASHGRVDHLLAKALQRRQGAALVSTHQPRVARDISRHDSGKAALLGHSGSPASRAPSITYSKSSSDNCQCCRHQVTLSTGFN